MSENMMEKLVSLCKRRGFIYPSSEIYGGFGSVYDYGPYGVELKNNIKAAWWKEMVQMHENITGLDAAILMNPRVWEASGHVESFGDPMVDCKECKLRNRADNLIEAATQEVNPDKAPLDQINEWLAKYEIKCPDCGGEITEARDFNLLMKTSVGVIEDKKNVVYLRGETCQGIYVNYKNVLDTTRLKLPFGIAQVGKAFRNEITPGNFIFRMREFEQMEMQLFCHPNESMEIYEYWKKRRMAWHVEMGLNEKKLKYHEHEKLAHYAKAAFDIEYEFFIGFKELEGLHHRGDWDLSRHQEYSGETLEYFDQATGEKFIPNVVETSVGLDRLFLTHLTNAYTEEKVAGGKGDDDTRLVLKFPHSLAPIKIAILPLSKKPNLSKVAHEIYEELRREFRCEYDETQSIGKRYRRQDEIGTPFCVTVDFGTIGEEAENQCKKGYVTVRDRDSLVQDQVKTEELMEWFKGKFK